MTSFPDGADLRERLILAGIREIDAHGVESFSMRRVAAECQVSCAAPYKHFRDKDAFLAAILDYISSLWAVRQQTVTQRYPMDLRQQLVESSLEYIRFLVENPAFRAILLSSFSAQKDGETVPVAALSRHSQQLIAAYAQSVGMDERTQRLKVYIVRSLIYGAAILFGTGELPYTEENMALAAYTIEREFDL
ncbi:MAG: TetR/AcrR family transcriptional regulator, partial [Muribaculaceae bacterium]|nr:TetR/AcrR family transcriptional regulator [Muribaculaceae bacterium]